MFNLEGKSALITGASGGIGTAIARALHKQGAQLALSGRRREPLEALANELGDRAHILICPLEETEAVKKLPQQAMELMSGMDILINNAGLTRDGLAMRMGDQDWEDVLKINLTAGFLLAKSALRGFLRQRWGRIIGISSVTGVIGNAGQANYAAAKAGMIGMTKSLAREVAPRGITANCIAPGFITTAMTDALNDTQRAHAAAQIPVGRFGTPQEIAAAALWLASEEAAYVTGQTIHINGGLAMP